MSLHSNIYLLLELWNPATAEWGADTEEQVIEIMEKLASDVLEVETLEFALELANEDSDDEEDEYGLISTLQIIEGDDLDD